MIGERERKYLRGRRKGARLWHLALVAPVVALLLVSTYSIAAPYHFFPTPVSDNTIGTSTVTELSSDHSAVVAAAFGFQAAGSSIITVRTYDARTGAILSEDAFDVNVKEEGASQHDGNKGRIFAGGIGTDSVEKSKFMLRVYDAETGRFLWEGQLNLLKMGQGGITQAIFTFTTNNPPLVRTSLGGQEHLQTLFSLRALNSSTGGLVWQDQFVPGIRKVVKKDGVVFNGPTGRSIHEPIEHIFDLIVRTYDRKTGSLLWEDSFEQLDRIEVPADEPDDQARPQAIPSWSSIGRIGGESHRTALR
ncbi:MAG: exported protein of unknown function [Nitrospira sp.]|jgi:hypothetical protein|nr:exported protein of unknown function [Nitrospira sp.]